MSDEVELVEGWDDAEARIWTDRLEQEGAPPWMVTWLRDAVEQQSYDQCHSFMDSIRDLEFWYGRAPSSQGMGLAEWMGMSSADYYTWKETGRLPDCYKPPKREKKYP